MSYINSGNPGNRHLSFTHENASVYSAGPGGNAPRGVGTAPSIYSAKTVTTYHSSYYTSDMDKAPLVEKSFGDKLTKFLWNGETKQFCGREFLSWIQILSFYAVFYIVLIGFWAACFGVFDFAILMEDYPVRTGEHNVLRMSPSLSYIPQPDHYTSLIRFKRSQKASIRKYVDEIVAVTQFYESHAFQEVLGQNNEILKDCARSGPITPFDERSVCRYDLDVGGRCNLYREFGFADGEPCIALKLNRIYGWIPDIPSNQTGIRVECYGVSASDKDAIGQICYHDDNDITTRDSCALPYGEFKSYYFPYLKQNRYTSPLIFVEFVKLKPNVIVMVECKAIARNININPTTREGIVRFELLSD